MRSWLHRVDHEFVAAVEYVHDLLERLQVNLTDLDTLGDRYRSHSGSTAK